MDPSVIMETANAVKKQLTGWTPWEFTWGVIKKGDCTMFEGAKWTLFPDGTVTRSAGTQSSWSAPVIDSAFSSWLFHVATVRASTGLLEPAALTEAARTASSVSSWPTRIGFSGWCG